MKKYLILFIVLFAGVAFSADIASLTKAAGSGKAADQFELGMAYLDENDLNKASEWLEKAARQGHAQAQYELGTIQFFGWEGVPEIKLKRAAGSI
jgi:TPR repeat protein